MSRVSCYVSFRETDGDRTIMANVRMDLPEYILSVGNGVTHEGLKLGGTITAISWFGGDDNGEDTDVSVDGDPTTPAILDAMFERFEGDERIDCLELSRGDSVIDFEPTAI